jgi:DNA polymerase-3 subunit epsilon
MTKNLFDKKELLQLPQSPGVYLLYDAAGMLLYVGKSKTVRARVRSHFAARDERWMMKNVARVEVRETAGELGALLLESQLIKELHPAYNVRARQARRLIVARRTENDGGYATVHLEAVDFLSFKPDTPVLGIFKHKTQAKEFLEAIQRTHNLCSKLLHLESARTYCFPYHLGRCGGACMGEENAAAYNARLDAAFEARRVIAWPFDGSITLTETSADGRMEEVFVIDNWCLMQCRQFIQGEDGGAERVPLERKSPRRFDYDSYKILYAYVMEAKEGIRLRAAAKRRPT